MRRLVGLLLGTAVATSAQAESPKLDKELARAWTTYVDVFVQADGRVVDHSANSVSTSEGQAYAMLRAAWIDDRETFDRTRAWSRANLQGGETAALPAWRWGQRIDGTWGVTDPQPASDADQLMAYAMLVGARRWKDPSLQTDALALMSSIWEQETLEIAGKRVLLPGPWAAAEETVRINPSYLLPFAYREFATVQPAVPWAELVDTSYALFEAGIDAYGLPPDWCWISKDTGQLVPPPQGEEGKLVYGYEAVRVPWTLAAEVQWFDEQRARVLLARIAHLGTVYEERGIVPARIAPGGEALDDYPYLGAYGALVPAWHHSRPGDARKLYLEQIAPVAGRGGWGRTEDYYAQNWVWLGLALWNGTAAPPEAR